MASIKGGLPAFHLPMVPLTWRRWRSSCPMPLILAAIGLIESLLTLNLVGEITGQRGGASQECVAQGAANTVTGFFGGMGGCAMIGQSMINVKSGGRTRLSGISAALFLLAFILVGAPVIERIPLAALVGVMFMVVIGTFAWHSLKILRKVPRTDALVIVLVTVVTVLTDLAIAVVVGVIVSALAYAWSNATRIRATAYDDARRAPRSTRSQGPLFFGSAAGFAELFDAEQDPVTGDRRLRRQPGRGPVGADRRSRRWRRSTRRRASSIQLRHLQPRLPPPAEPGRAADGRQRRRSRLRHRGRLRRPHRPAWRRALDPPAGGVSRKA